MARISLNPNKTEKKMPPRPDVSLCVVTHYTDDAYHKDRWDVVRLCLDSMLAGVMGVNYELLIWDNDSTPLFRRMLQSYAPAVLVESKNIGLHNAQNRITALAQGRILCMCDDDILFHPEWFAKQLEILKTYPGVGAVSGSPQRTAFRWAIDSNKEFGASQPGVKMLDGHLIPDAWERDYCLSVGKPMADHAKAMSEKDYLLEYKGIKAWAHGHHMQFMGHRDTIARALFTTDLLLDDGRKFNVILDKAGYLNLTTYERTAVHIGNVIDENIREIQESMRGKEKVNA
jgi:glycosyltransferase involved in cell wall biosynthesis